MAAVAVVVVGAVGATAVVVLVAAAAVGGGGGGGGVRRFKLVTLTLWSSSAVIWISVISVVVHSITDSLFL